MWLFIGVGLSGGKVFRVQLKHKDKCLAGDTEVEVCVAQRQKPIEKQVIVASAPVYRKGLFSHGELAHTVAKVLWGGLVEA